MLEKLKNKMTGETEFYEKKYTKLYGKQDFSSKIQSMKFELLKKYIALAIVAVLIIVAVIISESATKPQRVSVNTENEILIARPQIGENPLRIPMRLDVLTEENERISKNVTIVVNPEEAIEEFEIEILEEQGRNINIDEEIRKLINFINRSSSDSKIVLPTMLSNGLSLTWQEVHSSRLPMFFILFIILGVLIYQNRYAKIKLTEKEAYESIIRELPEFLNKLVLLLNAGLVLTGAFDRILENRKSRGEEEKSYFYSQLSQIGKDMRETNSSMVSGLKEFAARSGVRELTRATNIIADNATKGAELSEKLQGESELLWHTKKKLAEEKGRIAETKMTFPLVILLLILIMVTTAPALMEM